MVTVFTYSSSVRKHSVSNGGELYRVRTTINPMGLVEAAVTEERAVANAQGDG